MKVSVIVPIYNAEKYLKKCLDSLVRQLFEGLEIVLINDGSTDSSLSICQNYAEEHPHIHVYTTPNRGVSNARNTGMELARGTWITFLDSDDWISENYFKVLHQNPKEDLIFQNLRHLFKDREKQFTHFENQVFKQEDFLKKFTLHPHYFGPTAKFYRNSIICDYRLKFDLKLHYGEDSVFNIQYLQHCQTVRTSAYGMYFYRRGIAGSLSQKQVHYKDDLYFFHRLQEELKKIPTDNYQRNIRQATKYILYSLYQTPGLDSGYRKEQLRLLIEKEYKVVSYHLKTRRLKLLLKFSKFFNSYALLHSYASSYFKNLY